MIPQGFSGVEISTVDAVGKVTASTYAYGSDYTLLGRAGGHAYVKFSGYGIVTECGRTRQCRGRIPSPRPNQVSEGIQPRSR